MLNQNFTVAVMEGGFIHSFIHSSLPPLLIFLVEYKITGQLHAVLV